MWSMLSKVRECQTVSRDKVNYQKPNGNRISNSALARTKEKKKLITCWHCNYTGHVIVGCHLRKAGKPKHKNAGPANYHHKVQEMVANQDEGLQQMNVVTVSSMRIPSLPKPHLSF